MQLISVLAVFALALTSVEATKHGMHAGRLTLQDLLALRNGVILPQAELSQYSDVFHTGQICGCCV